MWFLDLSGSAYNNDKKRRFFIQDNYYCCPAKNNNYRRLRKPWYTVVEEWNTPESHDNTESWDYYTFTTNQDARVFIAELVRRLNSPYQQLLLKAAEKSIGIIKRLAKDEERQLISKLKRQTKEQEQQQKRLLMEQKKAKEARSKKSIYAFLFSDGRVKIGVSNNVPSRRQNLMQASGLLITSWCYTKPFPDHRAFEIESECHRFFSQQRLKGEFFNISYDETYEKLKSYGEVFKEIT